MAVNALAQWEVTRYRAFQWRSEISLVKKIALALAMAGVTGLLAQVRISLPFTPVPITGQTFAALMAGVLLGSGWGGLSMAIYAGLGIAGLPWFNGWTAGVAHLAGPTGGYLIGFILAALFVGYVSDKFAQSRRFALMLGLMVVANFVLVYLPGLLQLNLWLNIVEGKQVGLGQTLALGFVPFVIGDIIKVAAVTGVAWAVTPKRDFGKHRD
jgi:biotin transport system substrate-specific component